MSSEPYPTVVAALESRSGTIKERLLLFYITGVPQIFREAPRSLLRLILFLSTNILLFDTPAASD